MGLEVLVRWWFRTVLPDVIKGLSESKTDTRTWQIEMNPRTILDSVHCREETGFWRSWKDRVGLISGCSRECENKGWQRVRRKENGTKHEKEGRVSGGTKGVCPDDTKVGFWKRERRRKRTLWKWGSTVYRRRNEVSVEVTPVLSGTI